MNKETKTEEEMFEELKLFLRQSILRAKLDALNDIETWVKNEIEASETMGKPKSGDLLISSDELLAKLWKLKNELLEESERDYEVEAEKEERERAEYKRLKKKFEGK